jgi:hypothetical protein
VGGPQDHGSDVVTRLCIHFNSKELACRSSYSEKYSVRNNQDYLID